LTVSTLRVWLTRMRVSVLGASLFFCGAFAVAGALAACASGNSDDGPSNPYGSSSGSVGNGGSSSSSGGYDASMQSSDDSPTSSYGDAGTGTGYDGYVAPVDDGGEAAAPPTTGPTCTAGQNCVDMAPSGWTGYVQLVLQNGAAGTACTGPYASPQAQLTGMTNVDGGPATCAACTCGVPDSGPIACSMDLGGGACSGGMPLTVPQGSCVANPFLYAANGSGSPPVAAANAGPCGPGQGGQVVTPPPPPTGTLATICGSADDAGTPQADGGAAGATTTCTTTQACAAVPQGAQTDAGSPSGPCIYQAGVQDCPTGVAFTTQFVVGPIADDRGCSCSCGLPSCPADGYVQGYANTGCTGTVDTTISADAACQTFGGPSSKSFKFFPSHGAWAGACEPDDAGPAGSVTIDAGAATTFCCIP
jgi:hypothetical protein